MSTGIPCSASANDIRACNGAAGADRPQLARLRCAGRLGNCLLIGQDRKLPADGQVDAIDPERTSGPINLRRFSLAAGSQGARLHASQKGVVHMEQRVLGAAAAVSKRAKRPTALLREAGYLLLGLVSLATVTGLYFWLDVPLVAAAFTYLVVLVLLSLVSNLSSLIFLSFIGVCCLSYFFAPPIYSFRVDYPQDLITISAFVITSFIVNFLVTRVRVEQRDHMRTCETLRDANQRLEVTNEELRIENVERKGAEQALRELVEQQTAISEVVRAIANSPHDLQPIFDAILDSAKRLCRADMGSLRLFDERGLRLVGVRGDPFLVSQVWSSFPVLDKESFLGRLATSRLPAHIPDLTALEGDHRDDLWITAAKERYRTALFVPLLKDNEIVGVISLGRTRVQPFTDKQISLFTDFAAQASIALESTRRERQYREMQRSWRTPTASRRWAS